MKNIELHIVHAFSNKNGGNKAGVVLQADELSNGQKQHIAKQANLSETVFVSRSKEADFKLDFFTPTKRVPDCGHATVAAFFLLHKRGLLKEGPTSKETINGIRKIVIENDHIYMELTKPQFFAVKDTLSDHISITGIIDSLGNTIHEDDFVSPPYIVKAEVAFLILPFKSVELLKRVQPNFKKIAELSHGFTGIGYYLFAQNDTQTTGDVTTRMFAPGHGIDEESATGMAAGNLTAYLYSILGLNKTEFSVVQGTVMEPPSPSLIQTRVVVNDEAIEKIVVGGTAYISETKMISVPDDGV